MRPFVLMLALVLAVSSLPASATPNWSLTKSSSAASKCPAVAKTTVLRLYSFDAFQTGRLELLLGSNVRRAILQHPVLRSWSELVGNAEPTCLESLLRTSLDRLEIKADISSTSDTIRVYRLD